MTSEDKTQVACHVIGEDRISRLPDDVLTQILSQLPSVDAVATSVLSRDWTDKWTLLDNINIDDEHKRFHLPEEEERFVELMERLLRYTKTAKVKFKLVNDHDFSIQTSWISTLLRHSNIEDLHIDVLKRGNLKITTNNCFPNLKRLYLGNIRIYNAEKSISNTLILTFPVLKEITLANCVWNVTSVEIHAPTLHTFKSGCTPMGARNDYTIKIFAARIEMFCSNDSLENFLLSESNVISATLRNSQDFRHPKLKVKSGLHVRSMFEDFSSTLEELSLSLFLVRAVMDTEEISPPLPIFHKLRRLIIRGYSGYQVGNAQALLGLLEAMPFLKVLVIEKVIYWDNFNYDVVEYVPSCILSSLEEVEIKCYRFEQCKNLMEFLLETGAKLKRLRYAIIS